MNIEALEPPGTIDFLVMAQCLMSANGLSFPKTLKETVCDYDHIAGSKTRYHSLILLPILTVSAFKKAIH